MCKKYHEGDEGEGRMTKIFILALFCMLLLSGCGKRVKFKVETTECNTNIKDTVITYNQLSPNGMFRPEIATYKEAVPLLYIYDISGDVVDKRLNVCKIIILEETVIGKR